MDPRAAMKAGGRGRARLLVFVVIGLAHAPVAAVAQAPTTTVASATPLRFGQTTRIAGVLTDGAGTPRIGAVAQLRQNPWPYRRFVDAAHAITGRDGAYAFEAVKPDRNTRYRVVEPGGPAVPSGEILVTVAPRGTARSPKRGPARVRLSLLIRHSGHFRWRGERVFWYVRRRGARDYRPVARTRAREPRRGSTTAAVTVAPPSRRFDLRACLEPSDLAGTGPPPLPAHDVPARQAAQRPDLPRGRSR